MYQGDFKNIHHYLWYLSLVLDFEGFCFQSPTVFAYTISNDLCNYEAVVLQSIYIKLMACYIFSLYCLLVIAKLGQMSHK